MLAVIISIFRLRSSDSVIVNASAAKFGGAREILVRLTNSIAKRQDSKVVVVCPAGPDLPVSKGITYVDYSSSGFMTYFFSFIILSFLIFRRGFRRVVSLNNIGPLFGAPESYVYFHQEKAISGNQARMRLIRNALLANKMSMFVVQSERIRNGLCHIGIDKSRVFVSWPGVRIIKFEEKTRAIELLRKKLPSDVIEKIVSKQVVLIPVYDEKSDHKDFSFIKDIKNFLRDSNDCISISLCSPKSDVADYNLGRVESEMMDALYSISDFMILASNRESLCLPMFEYAQSGRPILAKGAAYIHEFKSQFPDVLSPVNVIERSEIEKINIRELKRVVNTLEKFPKQWGAVMSGDWGFVVN